MDKINNNSNNDTKYILEKYYRPSSSPILNNISYNHFSNYFDINYEEIVLSDIFFKDPKSSIINYFSLLREAANPKFDNKVGCGTLGYAKNPYPIAYNFFTNDYKKNISYNKYLKSFKNILHINLIKINEVPGDIKYPNTLKYFVELEVIEGSKKPIGSFVYYYGYVYIDKNTNKIKEFNFSGENYLCAPYHSWSYNAEYIVDIEYGDWCSLIKEKTRIEVDGYMKKVFYTGNDNEKYYVLFYELTNGTDIKIADFKKNSNAAWEYIIIDTKNCPNKK